ncbi:MAG: hypothetical protein R3D29_14435 [Nitratireductor sp.]
MSGDYDRHSFHYVGPDGDGDAGIDVFGMLRSEEEMTLYRGLMPTGRMARPGGGVT